MRAVGYLADRVGRGPECLVGLELPEPEPRPRDLMVRVGAVSVNPIDVKVRGRQEASPGSPVVLGFDAVGTVVGCGPEAQGFATGDRVWYAGDITRPGSNAEVQCVDHRVASRAPATLSDAAAAALPLTSLTAWELLFDRLPGSARDGSLLVVGAGGGVGSVLVQLAARVAGMPVIGTASASSADWVRRLGAAAVVDHRGPLAAQVSRAVAAGLAPVGAAAILNHSAEHFADVVEVLRPQGAVALIDDPAGPLDIALGKRKSISIHWESMFTRSTYGTADLARQGWILGEVARLVDAGVLRTTMRTDLGPITAANVRRGHEMLQGGHGPGKAVLAGWPERPGSGG